MGRKILLVTAEAQRYDGLGFNGGMVASTPVIDRLAAGGITYHRAHATSTAVAESLASLLEGRHPVALRGGTGGRSRQACRTVASVLSEHGYRSAVVGRFELPERGASLSPGRRSPLCAEGVLRHGFEHAETVRRLGEGSSDWGSWIRAYAPELSDGGPSEGASEPARALAGDTGLVGTGYSAIPPELYHADWTAERAIAWLAGLGDAEDWFCWLSFADPGYPWTPPAEEARRVAWRDLPLPPGHPGSAARCRRVLAEKPQHWLDHLDGLAAGLTDAPKGFVPAWTTLDQVREVNALVAAQAQLVDRALGRVLDYVRARGWDPTTDIVYTAASGGLQGDFGLLFAGPFAADGLLRVPLVWRPAPNERVPPASIRAPVSLTDVAPTLCAIAGVRAPWAMDGSLLPLREEQAQADAALSALGSSSSPVRGVAVFADGWLAAHYGAGELVVEGSGELYDLRDDPLQRRNRFADPSCRTRRAELLSLLAARGNRAARAASEVEVASA